MSDENVEQMRRFIAAFNTRDVDAWLAYFDPNGAFHSAFGAVGGEVYHGHDGLRRYQRDMEDAWGNKLRIEPEAYFDLGEQTLSFYALHGRGQHSGMEVAMRLAFVARWHDGLISYCRGYAHREDALADLGLSEDDLEPIAP
jgi:ketosteroid isomerase-like protein